MSITKLLKHKEHYEIVWGHFIKLVENLEKHSQQHGYKLEFDEGERNILVTFTDKKIVCHFRFFGDYSKLYFGCLMLEGSSLEYIEESSCQYVDNTGFFLGEKGGQSTGSEISSVEYLDHYFFPEILKALEKYWQESEPDED